MHHRMDLTEEELQEYLEACDKDKLVEIVNKGKSLLEEWCKRFRQSEPIDPDSLLAEQISTKLCFDMVQKIRSIKMRFHSNTTNSNADFFLDMFRKEDVEKNEKERIEIESKFVLRRTMHGESEAMRKRLSDADVPEEYGIELRKDLLGGLMIWGKYNGVWSQHPSNCAPLVMCLLLEANLLNK